MRLGAVELGAVALESTAEFYERVIGLRLLRREGKVAALGAGAEELVVLVEVGSSAAPAGPHTGLFHLAILVPSRLELARSLRRLERERWAPTGYSDHLVSEAIYLEDPEGNGIEIYRDRPQAEWPLDGGHIRMATEPLDLAGVLGEAAGESELPERVADGTTIGHVHLRVADVAAAEAFWHEEVGLDVMARYGQAASFLAAGGYHHHVGINSWGSAGAPPLPSGAPGLRQFELVVGDGDADRTLRDPSGNAVVLKDGAA